MDIVQGLITYKFYRKRINFDRESVRGTGLLIATTEAVVLAVNREEDLNQDHGSDVQNRSQREEDRQDVGDVSPGNADFYLEESGVGLILELWARQSGAINVDRKGMAPQG